MMNYEVNSFQNYESITTGELKDQANSLLNLVTEEQRPLRGVIQPKAILIQLCREFTVDIRR